MTKRRLTGIGVGGPLVSASLSWEYVDSDGTPPGGPAGGCLVQPNGQLPKVRQIGDPIMIGVHPSSLIDVGIRGPAGEFLPERIPAYVARDVDDELRRRVAASSFITLVGDSSAGKSRAAYEAIATLPDHVLIVPQNRTALADAVNRAAAARRCVLWLDDLENYLGSGGLTRSAIVQLLSGERSHRVIMATLRTAEEAALTNQAAGREDTLPSRRDAHEVLEMAHRILLPRMFSRSEQERARAQAWDPRIGDALRRVNLYGIAEYLAAGPELLRDWEDAWSPTDSTCRPVPTLGSGTHRAPAIHRTAGRAYLATALLSARRDPSPLPGRAWRGAAAPGIPARRLGVGYEGRRGDPRFSSPLMTGTSKYLTTS